MRFIWELGNHHRSADCAAPLQMKDELSNVDVYLDLAILTVSIYIRAIFTLLPASYTA